MTSIKEFILPVGIEKGGTIHRKGQIRPATAMDEIEVQETDTVKFNDRLRDIELITRVVTSIGEISPITVEIVENMYETDYIYLQMICDKMENSTNQKSGIVCPKCHNSHDFDLYTLFDNEAQ